MTTIRLWSLLLLIVAFRPELPGQLLVPAGAVKPELKAMPSDARATRRARHLYEGLSALAGRAVLFGHQDALAYGIGWKNIPGDSDVKRVSGDYPAVYGWDVGHIELGSTWNIDSVAFEDMRRYIRDGFRRGGVITISWHLHNPRSGGSSWDTTQAVRHILPGGEQHGLYMEWLSRLADFLQSLTYQGKPIPVLFRPYHEHTGNWFWWGEQSCTPEEYVALWRMTVDYLREQRRLHHLLYIYSPDQFKSPEHYLERYPGDAYVDVLGLDNYMHHDPQAEGRAAFMQQVRARLASMAVLSAEHGKLLCFSETGLSGIPIADWWTAVLWESIRDFPVSYVLVWRNAHTKHHYAPYPGQASADDFVRFAGQEQVWLQQDLRANDLYGRKGFWGWLLRR